MSRKRTSLERFRLKKVLDTLASKEGRGTELVSLYVPSGRQISEVTQMLKDEWGTASNIKSNTTRKNVQDAIVKVTQRLKLFKKVPDNGLVLFCGAIPQNGLGSERIEGPYVVVPPEPINIYLYRCDSKFHTRYLMDLLKETETYGILLLDSREATFAALNGRHLEIVQEITSGIPGKHRAGGQSAKRFERIREAKVLEFFKRVGKHANEIFLSIPDLKGVILGGPGPTKFDFEKGRHLDYRLGEKFVATIDTAYTGAQGVEEVVEKAPEIIRNVRYIEEKQIVQKFLYEVGHDTGLATYGEREVRRALKSGVVDTLYLSEALDKVRVKVECSSCGYTYHKTMKAAEISGFEQSMNGNPCPKCAVPTLQVVEEKDVIEELAEMAEQAGSDVEIISTETEEGQMLWKSFGGIVATLRYKLTG
ncbi:MAG: peptide chain release factor aRF-1 [Candidatus Bathyarchaeota archaeon]|nr:peptide chain release factor aRF-1 [Candidatus Bathyarchaeota archaeon]